MFLWDNAPIVGLHCKRIKVLFRRWKSKPPIGRALEAICVERRLSKAVATGLANLSKGRRQRHKRYLPSEQLKGRKTPLEAMRSFAGSIPRQKVIGCFGVRYSSWWQAVPPSAIASKAENVRMGQRRLTGGRKLSSEAIGDDP